MMHDDALPEQVKELVRRHIHSVAQLEALLFLYRRPPHERWDAESLATRLYAGKVEMADALAALSKDGFLAEQDRSYGFQPRQELRSAVEMLASAYSRHLIPITEIIHSKPRRIQAFSDAFRLRRE